MEGGQQTPAAPPGRKLRAGERRRVALSFAAFFLLLCSYYMLRPVRDEMGVRTGAGKLQWLFSGTFVFTLLIVPVFGWVVRRVRRAYLVPAVYGFLAANLLAFAAAFGAGAGLGAAAAFFIWLSVFNLFVNSLFWSTASDVFSKEQSHRVYGTIAAGGTVGALTGPALIALIAKDVPMPLLLAASAALLAGAAACLVALRRSGAPAGAPAEERPIGGSILAAIPLTARLASLRGVALLVICYSAVSTVLYVELVDQVGRRFTASGERTAFFAGVDFAANALALVMQLVGTSAIVQRFGLRTTLSVVPMLVMAGLATLVPARSALHLAAVQTVNRAGDYALMRPGREMIFTTVDAESRYKAKSFIDTTIYRANDALSAWVVAAVRAAGWNAILLAGIPAALLWMITGFRLGRRHDRSEPT